MLFNCCLCGWTGSDDERVSASEEFLQNTDLQLDHQYFREKELSCPQCGGFQWRIIDEDDDGFMYEEGEF